MKQPAPLSTTEWRRIFKAAKSAGVKPCTYWQWQQRGCVSLPWTKAMATATGLSKARICPRVYA